ncbi:MAG: prolipoprotein diacylglyceryl transferase [Flavobacteriales bacterium]
MAFPLHIDWTVNPNLIEDPVMIRWYGVLFALAFLLGHKILSRIFRNEGVPDKQLDQVLIYTMIGTIIGARLGHVFFYDWSYYSKHLMEIPQIWEGGLASHGGAIGIILALWVFSKKVSKRPLLWILDRVVTPIALGGAFIRIGNLMNHEIVGAPTDVPWAFVFHRLDKIPRHPSQIYEALAYLIIFGVLFYMYWRKDAYKKQGLLLGSFLFLVFIARFFIEFFKRHQTLDPDAFLSMGQWLSIPFVLIGAYLIFNGLKTVPEEEERTSSGSST